MAARKSLANIIVDVDFDNSTTSAPINLFDHRFFTFMCPTGGLAQAATVLKLESSFDDTDETPGTFRPVTNGAGTDLTITVARGQDKPVIDGDNARMLAALDRVRFVSDTTEDGIPIKIGMVR